PSQALMQTFGIAASEASSTSSVLLHSRAVASAARIGAAPSLWRRAWRCSSKPPVRMSLPQEDMKISTKMRFASSAAMTSWLAQRDRRRSTYASRGPRSGGAPRCGYPRERVAVPAKVARQPAPQLELGLAVGAVLPSGRHFRDAPSRATGLADNLKINLESSDTL